MCRASRAPAWLLLPSQRPFHSYPAAPSGLHSFSSCCSTWDSAPCSALWRASLLPSATASKLWQKTRPNLQVNIHFPLRGIGICMRNILSCKTRTIKREICLLFNQVCVSGKCSALGVLCFTLTCRSCCCCCSFQLHHWLSDWPALHPALWELLCDDVRRLLCHSAPHHCGGFRDL